MKKSKSALVSAAVAGLFLGAASATLTSCHSPTMTSKAMEKHACAAMNSCAGKGGCKTAANACAGKNTCAGKGGCATVEHHSCKTKNACKGQGGCKTASNACAGKNACKGQGGCAVPVKH
ncbi:MAG: hypothetical protein U1E73_06610 [Planctomycetota bacterium]